MTATAPRKERLRMSSPVPNGGGTAKSGDRGTTARGNHAAVIHPSVAHEGSKGIARHPTAYRGSPIAHESQDPFDQAVTSRRATKCKKPRRPGDPGRRGFSRASQASGTST